MRASRRPAFHRATSSGSVTVTRTSSRPVSDAVSLALNLETVPDLNQRRALAFALDRTSSWRTSRRRARSRRERDAEGNADSTRSCRTSCRRRQTSTRPGGTSTERRRRSRRSTSSTTQRSKWRPADAGRRAGDSWLGLGSRCAGSSSGVPRAGRAADRPVGRRGRDRLSCRLRRRLFPARALHLHVRQQPERLLRLTTTASSRVRARPQTTRPGIRSTRGPRPC